MIVQLHADNYGDNDHTGQLPAHAHGGSYKLLAGCEHGQRSPNIVLSYRGTRFPL